MTNMDTQIKMIRSRSSRHHKFTILQEDVLCLPEEVFEVFVDVTDELTLDKNILKTLQVRAGNI